MTFGQKISNILNVSGLIDLMVSSDKVNIDHNIFQHIVDENYIRNSDSDKLKMSLSNLIVKGEE